MLFAKQSIAGMFLPLSCDKVLVDGLASSQVATGFRLFVLPTHAAELRSLRIQTCLGLDTKRSDNLSVVQFCKLAS